MASPIQVILRQENFETVRETPKGGRKTDFFAGRDAAFQSHQNALADQLKRLAVVLETQPQGNVGVVKVILRREAWAKSHRPVSALFNPDRIPLVGGGDLGEMYFEARPWLLRDIACRIANAESSTNLKRDPLSGKLVPNPSSARSETGAIARIDMYGPTDRRRFSAEEAVNWLANPMTGSSYEVELFEIPPPHADRDVLDEGRRRLFETFTRGLVELGRGLEVQRVPTSSTEPAQLRVHVGLSGEPALVMLQTPPPGRQAGREVAPFDADVARHTRLLAFLEAHPLVRRIDLPPMIVRAQGAQGRSRPEAFEVPVRNSTRAYPKIGVIDGGVGAALNDWVIERWELLADADTNCDHGTFISGLAVGGHALNGPDVCSETDGAEIIDIAVFTDKPEAFRSYYPGGPGDFFGEIANAVAEARARHDARVFNLSLNIVQPVEADRYGRYAARLDAIAEESGALFVISAGNTEPQDLRAEWPAAETDALSGLANARNDGLLMPAESVRSLSVAALNPPGLPNVIPYAPARYSRRGPGLRTGVKPDLAHFGGTGSPQSPLGHGLFSLKPDGSVCDGCGTSYAAPLVAKTAAVLEREIEGEVSRETLMALLIHNAVMPAPLSTKTLAGVARHLVGFGVPRGGREILDGDDHEITLVLAHRIKPNKQIAFRFSWPPSLVSPDGKCRGMARLTLVATPPLDGRFGSEFVRVNVDAKLQQEVEKKGKLGWSHKLDPIYLPGKAEAPIIEAERIEHGLKWSPVKAYSKTFRDGVGMSSNWRMLISYLTRTGEQMPIDGVPFTALLTISDPHREAPVFNDMRAVLMRSGIQIEDIRTAARVVSRI